MNIGQTWFMRWVLTPILASSYYTLVICCFWKFEGYDVTAVPIFVDEYDQTANHFWDIFYCLALMVMIRSGCAICRFCIQEGKNLEAVFISLPVIFFMICLIEMPVLAYKALTYSMYCLLTFTVFALVVMICMLVGVYVYTRLHCYFQNYGPTFRTNQNVGQLHR
jgi:hypothetical protein